MAKPVIFISHIHEDSYYAGVLQEELDQALLGGPAFFNASDRASIRRETPGEIALWPPCGNRLSSL